MRRALAGIVAVAAIGTAIYWRVERKEPAIGTAYAGESKLTIWSSNAEVREPVDTVNFGQPLSVVEKYGENTKVRLENGKEVTEGWVATKDLIDSKLWVAEQDLTKQAEGMDVQGVAHTKAAANLRTDPGRDSPRFYRLDHDVPVSILRRRVLDVLSGPAAGGGSPAHTGPQESDIRSPKKDADPRAALGDTETPANVPTRKEDWVLVLAATKDTGPLKDVAGWVLARFVEMDLPQPLPNYTNAAGMRVAGWMVLNQVTDQTGLKPQYLVFGTKGPEGNPCDFTTLRVFTWDSKRQRYETAYIESNFCGQMPVHGEPATNPGGDANFHFTAVDDTGKGHRVHYHLHQTKVHRVGVQEEKSTG